MRWYIVFLGLGWLLCMEIHAVSYESTVLADNPSLYLRMNETSGTTAYNSGSNGTNGSYNTMTGIALGQTSATTALGTSVLVSGAGYINALVGSWLGVSNASWTVEAWFKTNEGGSLIGITSTPPGSGWNMPFVGVSSSQTLYGWTYGSPDGPDGYSTQTPIQWNQWYHVAVTYTASEGNKLYLNGLLVASNPSATAYTASGAADYFSTYIAGYKSPGVAAYYHGYLDEVAIYSTSLSASRIQSHYLAATVAVPEMTNFLLVFLGVVLLGLVHGSGRRLFA